MFMDHECQHSSCNVRRQTTSRTFVPQTELNSGEWLDVDVDDGDGGCRY